MMSLVGWLVLLQVEDKEILSKESGLGRAGSLVAVQVGWFARDYGGMVHCSHRLK